MEETFGRKQLSMCRKKKKEWEKSLFGSCQVRQFDRKDCDMTFRPFVSLTACSALEICAGRQQSAESVEQ